MTSKRQVVSTVKATTLGRKGKRQCIFGVIVLLMPQEEKIANDDFWKTI